MLSRLICWLWGHVWRIITRPGTIEAITTAVPLLCDRCGRSRLVIPTIGGLVDQPEPPREKQPTLACLERQIDSLRTIVRTLVDCDVVSSHDLDKRLGAIVVGKAGVDEVYKLNEATNHRLDQLEGQVGKAGACEVGLIRDRISERLAVVERVVVELKLRFDAAHHGSNQTVSYFSEPLPKRQSRKL